MSNQPQPTLPVNNSPTFATPDEVRDYIRSAFDWLDECALSAYEVKQHINALRDDFGDEAVDAAIGGES